MILRNSILASPILEEIVSKNNPSRGVATLCWTWTYNVVGGGSQKSFVVVSILISQVLWKGRTRCKFKALGFCLFVPKFND